MTIRLTILTFILTSNIFGQSSSIEKYVKKDSESYRHLIFKSDSTFEYIDNNKSFRDSANGFYQTKTDTVFLKSFTKCRDTVLVKFIEAGFSVRPSILLKRDDKLYLIDNCKVVDQKDQLAKNYKPPKGWRNVYHRKYLLFGPYIRKTKYTFYLQKDIRTETTN